LKASREINNTLPTDYVQSLVCEVYQNLGKVSE